jgi:hypothetical protein
MDTKELLTIAILLTMIQVALNLFQLSFLAFAVDDELTVHTRTRKPSGKITIQLHENVFLHRIDAPSQPWYHSRLGFPACGSIADRSAHDSNTSLLSFLLLFTAGINRFVADQRFFCVGHVVETARRETGFQPVVPHFKPSAFAANRTAAATRMQSSFNRGFHIAGAFRSSDVGGAIAAGRCDAFEAVVA